MKGLKKAGLIGAAGAALVAGLVIVSQAWAASGTLTVTSGEAEPGEEVTVDVVANVADPGLGAWTFDVEYDPAILSTVSCEGHGGTVCSTEFSDTEIRVTGATESGHVGETVLVNLTFQCGDAVGTSALSIAISVFADGTFGDPQDIDLTITEGEIVCAEPEPTATATATAVPPQPTTIVDTGSGGPSGGGSSVGWVIVALAVAGLASMGAFGALRLRRN